MGHAAKLGRMSGPKINCRGEKHGMARLNEGEVLEIIKRNKNGESQRSLAGEFDVNPKTISHIVRRITWAWLSVE
jgi:hypothetical protein